MLSYDIIYKVNWMVIGLLVSIAPNMHKCEDNLNSAQNGNLKYGSIRVLQVRKYNRMISHFYINLYQYNFPYPCFHHYIYIIGSEHNITGAVFRVNSLPLF